MTQEQSKSLREELIRMFVRKALTGNPNPKELAAIHRVIHRLEMKNESEEQS